MITLPARIIRIFTDPHSIVALEGRGRYGLVHREVKTSFCSSLASCTGHFGPRLPLCDDLDGSAAGILITRTRRNKTPLKVVQIRNRRQASTQMMMKNDAIAHSGRLASSDVSHRLYLAQHSTQSVRTLGKCFFC
jgi:hypothetical protein